MEDSAIVALYWARDEQALTETVKKFGAYCHRIAMNILANTHDAAPPMLSMPLTRTRPGG